MAEETINTVTKTSDGTVTVAIETYNELVEKAAEKAPIIHTTVIRTPEMVAGTNKLWGGSLMGIGATLFIIGAVQFRVGIIQASKLMLK